MPPAPACSSKVHSKDELAKGHHSDSRELDHGFGSGHRLVLSLRGVGPNRLSADLAEPSGAYRSVRSTWCDKDFATILFSEKARRDGKAKTLPTNLVNLFLSRGCLVSVLGVPPLSTLVQPKAS